MPGCNSQIKKRACVWINRDVVVMKWNGGWIDSLMLVSRRIACRRNSCVIVIYAIQTCIYTHSGIKHKKKKPCADLGGGKCVGYNTWMWLFLHQMSAQCNTNNILENETNTDWSLL